VLSLWGEISLMSFTNIILSSDDQNAVLELFREYISKNLSTIFRCKIATFLSRICMLSLGVLGLPVELIVQSDRISKRMAAFELAS
jgi:hypothetical protein